MNDWQEASLESQLLEEPLVLTDVVSFFKFLFDFSASTSSLAAVLQHIFVDDGFVQSNIDTVSGGHQMVVVDDFDERLDLGALGNLLLSHRFRHFSWIFVDSRYEGVSVGSVLCAVVAVLYDDCFSTGVFSSQHQNNFSRFHKLSHFDVFL